MSADRQALLVLAHLSSGHTTPGSLPVSASHRLPVHRRGHRFPGRPGTHPCEAVKTASAKGLDGTLLPIDHIAADRPFHSGKHKKHGMNVQVITDPAGRLLWASPARPGVVHGIKAARTHDIIER